MESLSGISSFVTSLPLDWFILGGIVIVIALDSLKSGLGRAVAVSLALPIAFVLFELTGQTVFLGSMSGFLKQAFAQALLFIGLFAALYILIRRMEFDAFDSGQAIPAVIGGISVAVVFICVWLSQPVLSEWWTFNETIQSVFRESFRLPLLLAAYAALAFARG